MRFLDIDLRAFGPFTGRQLDLSGGDFGLHLVYGRNEAGKSSTLRAMRALLYGIDDRTPDKFIHDYSKLLLGARIQRSDGETLAFLRRKGSKNTLLDPAEQAIDESALDAFLSGVDSTTFTTLFGIDHRTLRDGGAEILAGRGEVGQTLFAASVGRVSLRGILDGLDKEADALFRPKGKTQSLNKAIGEYHEAQRLYKQNSLSGEDWKDHHKARREAGQRYETLREQLRLAEREKSRLERTRVTLPRLVARADLLERLQEAADAIILPASFAAEHVDAARRLGLAQSQRVEALEAIDALTRQHAELVVPEALLGAGPAIESLFQRIERVGKDDERLVDLRREREAQDRAFRARCIELAIDPSADVDALRPPLRLKQRIRELGQQRQALEQAARTSTESVTKLRQSIEQRTRELEGLGTSVEVGDLRRAVDSAARLGDVREVLDALERTLAALEQQVSIDLKRLGLSGTLEEIESLPVPAVETADRFELDFTQLKGSHGDAERRRDEAAQQLATLDQQLEEQRLQGSVPTEEELDRSRATRDQTWRAMRHDGRPLAGRDDLEPYERQVLAADDLSDRLRREAERVARYAAFQASRAEASARLSKWTATVDQLALGAAELTERWIAAWAPSGLTPQTPREMRSWLQSHTKLVETARQVRLHRQERDQRSTVAEQHRVELYAALAETGSTVLPASATLDRLMVAARDRLSELSDRATRKRSHEEEIKREQSALTEAQRKEHEAAGRWETWKQSWEAEVRALRLQASVSPDEATATLDAIEAMLRARDETKASDQQIESITLVADRFRAAEPVNENETQSRRKSGKRSSSPGRLH